MQSMLNYGYKTIENYVVPVYELILIGTDGESI